MRQLWHDIGTHRLAAALFLVLWFAIWWITVTTWSGGMNTLVVCLHLLMPFVAGVLAGWWRNSTAGNIKGGILAGLLFCVIDFAILAVFQSLPEPGRMQSSFWGEALGMGLIYTVIGIVLGTVGGIISELIAAALHRVRG